MSNDPSAQDAPIQLSVYGYGMMSFATAMVILISQGFFTHNDADPLLSWGMAIFAGASGALALSMVRSYFPNMRSTPALILATVFNVFLFGCYFTSYFGYSRLYVIQTNPEIMSPDAMSDFAPTLLQTWLNTALAAAGCSAAYAIIQRSLHGFTSLMMQKS